jgi:hypothetical protein
VRTFRDAVDRQCQAQHHLTGLLIKLQCKFGAKEAAAAFYDPEQAKTELAPSDHDLSFKPSHSSGWLFLQSLELADSDDDCGSSMSSDGVHRLNWILLDSSSLLEDAAMPSRRRVNSGFVQVREYLWTMGSNSAAKDTCPLQLSWKHGEDIYSDIADFEESQSSPPKKGLRRLSLQERRRWIAAVQGISVEEVEAPEYEKIFKNIQEVMFSSNIVCKDDHNRGCFRLPRIRAFKAVKSKLT